MTHIKFGDMKVLHTPKLCLIVWKDKKVVSLLTTHECPVMMTTGKLNRRTEEYQEKPNVVISYNNNMGGVDLSDQIIHLYELLRKTVKWYRKVFFHFLDMATFSASVVYNSFHPEKKMKKNQLDFRLALVDELLKEHCNQKTKTTCKAFSQPSPHMERLG
ncbi:piggyBac transposable element-derived protein 4-like [Belonocnema kinseyi]|uniref:piggyBac transposable element-derived protein 4-like n=1 Tax=Belonocnema kinseyi TaxID=2817044 RepID=UPI00143D87B4|nr:piggyBac transposable element-derived protein 4-like [Belonocnema kinseyi]